MFNIMKIAVRNLARFHRRTWLTSTLITLGIVAVLLFIATAGSFKTMMIGQLRTGCWAIFKSIGGATSPRSTRFH